MTFTDEHTCNTELKKHVLPTFWSPVTPNTFDLRIRIKGRKRHVVYPEPGPSFLWPFPCWRACWLLESRARSRGDLGLLPGFPGFFCFRLFFPITNTTESKCWLIDVDPSISLVSESGMGFVQISQHRASLEVNVSLTWMTSASLWLTESRLIFQASL